MAERVEVMVRGQRELLGAISHELRSPLGRARVALEIARDRLPSSEDSGVERPVSTALDDVEKQLGAVDGILGDLLDVTRAGLADLRKEKRAFIPWLRTLLAEEPASPGVTLQVDSSLEDLALPFDPPLLARAVHNLVRNARAYGHPGDQPINVRVTREVDAVRILVRDRGPGFAPGLAERAFEPFVRGDAARTRSAGTGSGLGLTIVRSVVEAHGGQAFARNAADASGAEVGFDLPHEVPPR